MPNAEPVEQPLFARHRTSVGHHGRSRIVVLGFCLFVIAAVLVLPQVDLLDAAGAEITAVVTVKGHFGTPQTVRLDRLPVITLHEPLSLVDSAQSRSPEVLRGLLSSQDFLCLLRC